MTSDFMAGSIGTNPVIIRKMLQQLKATGLIEFSGENGGVVIIRSVGCKGTANQKLKIKNLDFFIKRTDVTVDITAKE